MKSNFLEFWIYIVLGCDMLTAGFAQGCQEKVENEDILLVAELWIYG
jgi:putative Mn2+ efflux pump MntP